MKPTGKNGTSGEYALTKTSTVNPVDILIHDLKSPFGNIKASTELLLHDISKAEKPELERVLQRILRQSDKGLNLIRKTLLREISKTALQRERIPLRAFLETCLQDHLDKARGKKLTLHLNPVPNIAISANALYLSQILDNLLQNAMKFSAEGGLVDIACREAAIHETAPEWKAIIIHVSDRGRGIANDRLPFVFMERVQAEARDHEQGQGLGLAICKQFCELHGGTIWVNSQLGHGSTFSFVLPWKEETGR